MTILLGILHLVIILHLWSDATVFIYDAIGLHSHALRVAHSTGGCYLITRRLHWL